MKFFLFARKSVFVLADKDGKEVANVRLVEDGERFSVETHAPTAKKVIGGELALIAIVSQALVYATKEHGKIDTLFDDDKKMPLEISEMELKGFAHPGHFNVFKAKSVAARLESCGIPVLHFTERSKKGDGEIQIADGMVQVGEDYLIYHRGKTKTVPFRKLDDLLLAIRRHHEGLCRRDVGRHCEVGARHSERPMEGCHQGGLFSHR